MLGGGHLVVMLLDGDPQVGHGEQHFAAHVLQGVVRGDGEVTLFQLDLVGEVAAFLLASCVPGGLNRIAAVEAAAIAGVEADIIKDEKFRLRTKEGGVSQAGACQVIDGLLGQGTGAALIGLAAAGLLNRADQTEGFFAIERIHPGRAGIGNHRHVGFVDRLPAADGGAVECQAFGEGFLFNEVLVHSQVLPFAMDIGKFQIDQFDSFVVDLAKDVLRCLGHERRNGRRAEP